MITTGCRFLIARGYCQRTRKKRKLHVVYTQNITVSSTEKGLRLTSVGKLFQSVTELIKEVVLAN